MPKDDWKKKYENDDFGMNASHGAENTPCIKCKYRKIYEMKNGKVIDTGRGSTCEKYPVLKPMSVMTKGADCPKFEEEKKD